MLVIVAHLPAQWFSSRGPGTSEVGQEIHGNSWEKINGKKKSIHMQSEMGGHKEKLPQWKRS